MRFQKITLRSLVASNQPRPLITAEVDKLAASIRGIGLIQPITVKPSVVIHGTAESGYQIVAGHHRVAACRALGWTEIDALVIEDAGHLQTELIEIDENLCRAELTASQRTKYTKRRKQIWEALHPSVITYSESRDGSMVITGVEVNGVLTESGTTCPTLNRPATGRGNTQFAAETASLTGQSKRDINRAIARADALGEEALTKVANTSLDSGVELDALVKLDASERDELIERAAAGEQVSARSKDKPEPVEAIATDHVLHIINAMDLMARYASREGMTADRLANRFLDEIDKANPIIADRLAATTPFMAALGRIAKTIATE